MEDGSATASVSCLTHTYTATPTVSVDGGDSSMLIIEFDPLLPDQDCCRIDLAGPSKGVQYVAILHGDADRNKDVNSLDYSAVKLRLGHDVDETTCQCDVNADGDINSLDYSYIKLRLGHVAPLCPTG